MLLLLGMACGRPDAPPDPGETGCPDPGAREEQAFDLAIAVTTPPAPDDRFLGGGVTVADFDGDAILDLALPGPAALGLHLGRGDGTFAPASAVPDRDFAATVGSAAADYDGDGDLDLFVSRYQAANVLLQNQGDGTFVDVSAEAGVAATAYSHSAAWGDTDGDGWLDLVVAGRGEPRLEDGLAVVDTPADPTRLYRNRGDGTFEDRSADLPQAAAQGYTFVVSFVDFDRDGRLDLYFANDYPAWQRGLVVWNRATGWVEDDGSAGLNAYIAGMGLGLGDANGDGRDDVLLTGSERVMWLESVGDQWADATAVRGLAPLPIDGDFVGWGAEVADLDNDGALDAWAVFGHLDTLSDRNPAGGDAANDLAQHDLVWAGGPDGFTAVNDVWGIDDPGVGRGLAIADLDANGWPDVVTRDLDGPVRVHLGRCGAAGWLTVALAGEDPNRFGIGAVVRAWTGDTVQTRTVRAGGTGLLSSGPPEVYFGLGAAASVDRVEVTWPDGHVTVAPGPLTARQRLVVP